MITDKFINKLKPLSIKVPPKPQVARSKGWPAVRRRHLELEPTCQACGTTKSLEVHHILPFHIDPLKELDQSNLITLCESSHMCHFIFGHIWNWENYNPTVREFAPLMLNQVQHAI